MIEISSKQAEFIRKANKRYNVKMGATQSGKTYIDTRYVIPQRLVERKDESGINVIVGVSKETIERNVLTKMRDLWGIGNVSEINSRNIATLFGEKVYCLGAKDKGQVSVFRGATIKYLYVDEFPDISEDVFNIFPSRLSTSVSVADMTGNPKDPNHWSEKWLTKTSNIYFQRYTLFDNPFLTTETKNSIISDYNDTVYYDRYVLGLPKRAEGIVFPQFANNPTKWIVSVESLKNKHFEWVEAGFDIGGNKSAYAFTVTAKGYDGVYYCLYSRKTQAEELDMAEVEDIVRDGVNYVINNFNVDDIEFINTDHVDVIINHLNRNTRFHAGKTYKPALEDRPFAFTVLFSTNKFLFVENACRDCIEEIQNLVFDNKKEKAIVLDDGSMQIDTWDSLVYSIVRDWRIITERE